ncbi:MAG: hypothetical protein PUB53_07045 [Bacteroidales bacterium]|nr:hypothetical protein [Bacteroidales bacterium]
MNKDVNASKIAISIACTFASLLITAILQFALHEVGHLLFGLASGYKFSSIRIYKYAIVKDDSGFHIKKFNIQGTGGQCIMTLPEDTDPSRVPFFWYNAGGVIVNILLFAISMVVLSYCDLGMVADSFFIMLAFTGAFIALTNGVPLSFNGLCNDGRNILLLMRNKRSRRFFLRMMQVASELSRGKRLKDMPREWFEDIPVDSPKDYFLLANRINYAALLEDSGRFDEARRVYEEISSFGKDLPGMIKLEIGADHILMELLTTARHDIVDTIYDKSLQAYINSSYKFSPIKAVALYALALHHDNAPVRAKQLLDELESHRKEYLMPGEYLTAIYLIGQCDLVTPGKYHHTNSAGTKDETRAIVTAYRNHVCPKHILVISPRMSYAINATSRKNRQAK